MTKDSSQQLVDRRHLLALAGAAAVGATAPAQAADASAAPLSAADYAALWARAEALPLWPGRPPGGAGFRPQTLPADWPVNFVRNVASPALRVFPAAKPSGQAVLVIPGGAYEFVSIANEGVDMAARLNPLGVTVFVLTYRLPGEGWAPRSDVPLQDAQRAMRLIRARADAFGIDGRRLATIGFSAGGHLAATLATDFARRSHEAVDAVDALSARPFAAGLIYPVVTMAAPLTHALSRRLLLGADAPAALVEARSPELQVGADTPPIFLAHALDDGAVPAENSVLMLNAMRQAKRPVEAHFFQEGNHAFGVGRPGTASAQWIALFLAWLERAGAAAG